jgi:hypothetical protein
MMDQPMVDCLLKLAKTWGMYFQTVRISLTYWIA